MLPIDQLEQIIIKRLHTDREPVESHRLHCGEFCGVYGGGIGFGGYLRVRRHIKRRPDFIEDSGKLFAGQISGSASAEKHRRYLPTLFLTTSDLRPHCINVPVSEMPKARIGIEITVRAFPNTER